MVSKESPANELQRETADEENPADHHSPQYRRSTRGSMSSVALGVLLGLVVIAGGCLLVGSASGVGAVMIIVGLAWIWWFGTGLR